MARVPKVPTRREVEMRPVVEEFEGSGLSLEEFCARRGLRPSLVEWYRRELRLRDRVRSAGVASGVPAMMGPRGAAPDGRKGSALFVEVCASSPTGRGPSGVRIRLRGGQEVEVDPGFDRGTLVAVVQTLEGAC